MAAHMATLKMKQPNSKKRYPWFSLAVLTGALIFFLLPVYVMIINGLKDAQHVSLSTMWNLPETLSAGGLVGAINGYFLSKWKFRGADGLFTFILFGFFIPYQVILLPLVQFMQTVGLYGTITGLVVVHVIYGIPVTTLIFRNFYTGVPNELIEAAVVDGGNKYQIFSMIMFPLAVPAFVVVGIFQFTNIWNDFIFGVTVVPNPQAQPVTIALNNLSGNFSVDWNVVMAGAVLAALPTAIVYIFLSRYFVRGLLAGSVKG